jgi:DNA topoisomerase VI subunit B
MPAAPLVIMIHVASVWVPFTSVRDNVLVPDSEQGGHRP